MIQFMIRALRFSVPLGIGLGLIFSGAVEAAAPAMKPYAAVLSVLIWVVLLTPLLALVERSQEQKIEEAMKKVSEGKDVQRHTRTSLYLDGKLVAPGLLLMTDVSLMFYSTDKRKEQIRLQYPYFHIDNVRKEPGRSSRMTVVTDKGDGRVSFSVPKERDVWVNQLNAKSRRVES